MARYIKFFFFKLWHDTVKGHGLMTLNAEGFPPMALCSCAAKFGNETHMEAILAQMGLTLDDVKGVWK